MDDQLTLGEVATRLGVQLWQIQRLYELGKVSAAGLNERRLGRQRYILESEVPAIRKLLFDEGRLGSHGPAMSGGA